MVATASNGLTAFGLKLNAEDSAVKPDQLIELARVVAEKI